MWRRMIFELKQCANSAAWGIARSASLDPSNGKRILLNTAFLQLRFLHIPRRWIVLTLWWNPRGIAILPRFDGKL
jgi:hypothetical protein